MDALLFPLLTIEFALYLAVSYNEYALKGVGWPIGKVLLDPLNIATAKILAFIIIGVSFWLFKWYEVIGYFIIGIGICSGIVLAKAKQHTQIVIYIFSLGGLCWLVYELART